jgi:hypothetical protein
MLALTEDRWNKFEVTLWIILSNNRTAGWVGSDAVCGAESMTILEVRGYSDLGLLGS